MRRVKISLIACGMLCLFALSHTWTEASESTTTEKAVSVPDPYGRSTPRQTLLGFLKAGQTGQWDVAAYYLQLPPAKRESQGKTLSLQLKKILDQHYTLLIGEVSDQPEGNLSDGFPPDQERVCTIEGSEGSLNLILIRVPQKDAGPIWLFSAETLANIGAVYERTPLFWVEEKLPAVLVEKQFLGVALWKWLLAVLLIPALLASLWLLFFVAGLLMRLAGREEGEKLSHKAFGPVGWLLVILLHWLLFRYIGVPILFRYYQNHVVGLGLIAMLLWLAMGGVDRVVRLMIKRTRGSNRAFALSIFSLIRGIAKAILIIVALFLVLWGLGFNLGTALAGLGIGGIAIALGAQKTLENLIGGVSMLTDRVLQVGDWCKIGGQIGTVEDISLRSTKIRTLDGSLLAIPNGVMATINLENLSNRRRYLFNPLLSLRYETTAEKVLQGLENIRGILNGHPRVDPADLRVSFKDFGASSLDVEVFAYILTSNRAEYIEIRQQLLLQIMRVLESAGIGFAFPSQTLYLTRDSCVLPQRK